MPSLLAEVLIGVMEKIQKPLLISRATVKILTVNRYLIFQSINFFRFYHADYDATLSEAGDYTEKYNLAATLIEKYENPKLRRPSRPAESTKIAYPTLTPEKYLTYDDIVQRVPASSRAQLSRAISMEELPINNNSGQSFGYIIYRKKANIVNGDRYRVSVCS